MSYRKLTDIDLNDKLLGMVSVIAPQIVQHNIYNEFCKIIYIETERIVIYYYSNV